MTSDAAEPLLLEHQADSRTVAAVVSFGLALLLGILWFARFSPIVGFTPSTDSGVYLYIGQQVLKGAAPYRDVFDNKGPLLYLVNALGLALSRGAYWGVYVLEYCLLAVSSILIFRLLRVRVGWLVAAASGVFFVLEATHIAIGNHEEEYAVALQCIALFLLVRRPTIATGRLAWFVAGLLGAGAFFLKPTGVGLWVALLVTVALIGRASGQWRPWTGCILVLAAGAAVASAAVVAYLAMMRALGAFTAAYFSFNVMYASGNTMADRMASVLYGAGRFGYPATAAALFAWLLTLRRVLRHARAHEVPDVLALLAVVWLPVEVVLSCTSGYSRVQYYFPWVVPASLLLAFGVVELNGLAHHPSMAAPSSARVRRLAVVLLVVFALGGLLMPTEIHLHRLAGGVLQHRRAKSVKPQALQIAAYVDAHTLPRDYVLVWGGYDASVNFLAERRSPSRWVMQLALYYDRYGAKGVPEFLRELKANPPALILDTSPSYGSAWRVAVPPIDSTSNPWASSQPAVAAAWASVFAYLHEHYRSAGALPFAPRWPVYVQR